MLKRTCSTQKVGEPFCLTRRERKRKKKRIERGRRTSIIPKIRKELERERSYKTLADRMGRSKKLKRKKERSNTEGKGDALCHHQS